MSRKHATAPFPLEAFAQLPKIQMMGMMPLDSIWRDKIHQSWCCELLYILNGSLTIETKNGRRVTGTTSELLLIPNGVWHRDDYNLNAAPRVFMLFFSWTAEALFWRLFPPRARHALRIPMNREITAMFDCIQTTLSSGTAADEITTRAYVLAILMLIARTRPGASDRRTTLAIAADRRRQAIILKAKQYIDQHYREPISLRGIAAALGVSSYYLSHVFSRENDFSLFEYLTSLRMRQARLLLQQGQTIKATAAEVGYDNLSYFSKVFHRHFDAPPRIVQGMPFAIKAHRRRPRHQ